MLAPYLLCGVLLLGSVLARALPAGRRSYDEDYEDGWDLSPRELAYLRRGPYGVVLTVLADLHGEGAVDLGSTGHGRQRARVRRLDPPRDCDDRLAIAVYSGLNWFDRPGLSALAAGPGLSALAAGPGLALLPRVRRACAPLRDELRARRLLPPVRRRVFAAALLLYAVGLAGATALEQHARGSTVVGAAAVSAVAVLLAVAGPRRTLAGRRELVLHRDALARVARDHHDEAAYLSDLVPAYGVAAVQVLCTDYVPAGALAPPRPSYEPLPASVRAEQEPLPAILRAGPEPPPASVRVLPVRPARLAPVDLPIAA